MNIYIDAVLLYFLGVIQYDLIGFLFLKVINKLVTIANKQYNVVSDGSRQQ